MEKNEEDENELLIENVLGYLENHYADDITLNELAEHKYFVSVGHLSRTFKNKTGLTFSKYLTELRLKKAIEFLKNTRSELVVETTTDTISRMECFLRITTSEQLAA